MADKKNWTKEEIQKMLDEISESEIDATVLKEYITIPNQLDMEPEILSLAKNYGPNLFYVIGRIENLRHQLGLSYDTLRNAIIEQIEQGRKVR